MKFDLDPEKMLRWAHLRPRPQTEEQKRHGTFNRRMMAASIDTLLLTALVAPVVDYFFMQAYGAPTLTFPDIAQAVNDKAPADGGEAFRLMLDEMRTTGFLERWTLNLRWQMFMLCVYTIVCWHYWAATPGKMLCRLKVVDAKTGGPMGDWQSILRVIGYFISAIPLGLGFMWIGLDKKRRGWHDLLAGTEVVVIPWKKKKEEPSKPVVSDNPPTGWEDPSLK